MSSRTFVEWTEGRVRLCWPRRHASPLHRAALRVNLSRLHRAHVAWAGLNPAAWSRWRVARDLALEGRAS